MKRLFFLGAWVCVVAMFLPACAPAPEPEPEAAPEPPFDQAAEEAAIRGMIGQFFTEANKHDIKAALTMCVEDIEDWEGSLKGHAAFEEYYTEFWGRNKDRQYEVLDEIGIVFVTPDVAIYKYRDEATGGLDAEGNPNPPQKRLQAAVLVKKEDKWLFAAASFTRPIEE